MQGLSKSSFWKLDTERTNYVFHIFTDFGIFLYSTTLYTVSWYSVTVSWYSDEHQAAKPEFHDFKNRFKSSFDMLRRKSSKNGAGSAKNHAKRCILRRYWTVLLQEKNFGPNVIYYVSIFIEKSNKS